MQNDQRSMPKSYRLSNQQNKQIKNLFKTPTYKNIIDNTDDLKKVLSNYIENMGDVKIKLGVERQAKKGLAKYGQLLDDNQDLTVEELEIMLDEEIFDSFAYLSKLMLELEKEKKRLEN
jgi:hypothetical protein